MNTHIQTLTLSQAALSIVLYATPFKKATDSSITHHKKETQNTWEEAQIQKFERI